MHNLEVIISFLIAGIGTCFTGIILDHVQDWKVFTDVGELFILLPALLGLKGNLQMTLASRFSTHFHLGHVKDMADLLKLTCANISLNQCFSIIISSLAVLLSELMHFILSGKDQSFHFEHATLVMATALLTSSVTSFLLDTLMIMVVQTSALLSINPDNVASPVASSLGDMTALTLCALLADLFYSSKSSPAFYWLTVGVICGYLISLPLWANVAMDNQHTARMLGERSNWYPLITAMGISSTSGIILKIAVPTSEHVALFAPVLSGVSGNVAAVQASRLSTSLHRDSQLGTLPRGEQICMNPCDLVTSPKPSYDITKLLLIIIVPGQLLFYFFCVTLNGRLNVIDATFTLAYLGAAFTQVMMLLYLTYVFTYSLWSRKTDPDSCAIPYLTSISDVTGACFVTLISHVANPARNV